MPRLPNILVTGTPGTGKTSMCQLLAVRARLAHVTLVLLGCQSALYSQRY